MDRSLVTVVVGSQVVPAVRVVVRGGVPLDEGVVGAEGKKRIDVLPHLKSEEKKLGMEIYIKKFYKNFTNQKFELHI